MFLRETGIHVAAAPIKFQTPDSRSTPASHLRAFSQLHMPQYCVLSTPFSDLLRYHSTCSFSSHHFIDLPTLKQSELNRRSQSYSEHHLLKQNENTSPPFTVIAFRECPFDFSVAVKFVFYLWPFTLTWVLYGQKHWTL